MSSNSLFVILAIIVLPSVVLATDYVVGDEVGWTIGFDYKTWTAGKQFYVGDTLLFKYPVGVHNVFKVNGTSFKDCVKPPQSEALTSGNDLITLATPGRKWYICGFGKHCQIGGQKLFITVYDTWAPIPLPIPFSAPAPAPAWYN
ncbi:Uclacyanin [Thalictrum thalictroides]|uniref:Uclacyanin n=1 Tax=Thalictrum thalictroides TaxID=46969 RepID=A0A7J6XAW2_THATH|nr:Uclacyanin [Thalictrum thalictroides]